MASKRILLTMSLCLPGLVPAAAFAQERAHDAGLDEIVVTARKKAENLQDTPVAITSFSQEELAARNILDIRGLAQGTPGMALEQNPRSSMAFSVVLRGQLTRDAVITNDQSIGLYIDDVYRARTQGAITGLFDVQQIQVLRGVQGTLFGRNNTGGAILISTVPPQYELGAKAVLAFGNFDATRFEGVVNVPIIDDKAAVRVSMIRSRRDGVIKNLAGGPDGNSRDFLGLRAQARLNPTEGVESIYRYTYGEADQVPNTAIPNGPGLGFTPPAKFYQAVAGAAAVDALKAHTHSLTTTIDLGGASLKNILAYHRQNVFTRSDSEGYPTPLLDVDLVERQKQYTAELQLSGDLAGDRLSWLLGGYYFDEKGESSSYVPAIGREGPGFAQNEATALFGHLDFTVSDRFSVGGGLRYTWENRAVQSSLVVGGQCQIAVAIRPDPNVCFAHGKARFRYLSWEANADYRLSDDVLLYARAGKGQKAGGFNNITNDALLNPFRPEKAQDVEAGVKADWLGRTLRTNLAVYRTNYDDIQRTQVVTGPGGSPITRVDNAAKARIQGLEAEVQFRPVRELTLSGGFAYTDAEYRKFLYGGTDVSANAFPMVSKYTYSFAAAYDKHLEGLGDLGFRVDWSYRSRNEFEVLNQPDASQKGYGLLGSRLSFALEGNPGVRLALFGTNLTDRKYNVASVSMSSFGYYVLYRGEPRMVGLEIAIDMGGERR
ncbi:MAG: TonB-dependent receptor [Novosphingobium sp.]|nr:TonB-dependent receptor [Novosphingobium sp.]